MTFRFHLIARYGAPLHQSINNEVVCLFPLRIACVASIISLQKSF